MDNLTTYISILIAVLGLVVSIAAFFLGRFTSHKEEGKETGAIKESLEYIKKGMDEMKEELRALKDGQSSMRAQIEVHTEQIREIKRQTTEARKGA